MKCLVATLAALVCLVFQVSAQQEQFLKKSVFTVDEAVEIPGAVLKPGKYVMRLRAATPQRNVLQIFNVVQVLDSDEKHLYATIFSMPDYNLAPPNKPLFSFYEAGPGLPKAVRAWFHPSDNYGEQFVYPRTQAAELAKVGNQSILSMPSLEMLVNVQNSAKPAEPKRTALPAQARPPAAPVAKHDLEQLPQTASSMPMLAWIGLICLLSAALVRAVYRWMPEMNRVRRGNQSELRQLRQENRALATKVAASTYQNYQLMRQRSGKTE